MTADESEKQVLESLLRDEISHGISLQEEIHLHVENPQGLKNLIHDIIDVLVEIEAGIACVVGSAVAWGVFYVEMGY
jgi:hypothetical protein